MNHLFTTFPQRHRCLAHRLSGQFAAAPGFGQFVTPPGLDLSPMVSRGNAVLYGLGGELRAGETYS